MAPSSSTGKMFAQQNAFFKSGGTLQLRARQERLLALKKMIIENAEELAEAVFQDVKWAKEKTMNEDIFFILKEIDYILENHEEWIHQKVRQSPKGCIDQPMPVDRPLGVVLVVSAPAEPLRSALVPLVSVIGAGNTAIIWQQSCPTCNANTIEKLDSLLRKYVQQEVCFVTITDTSNISAMMEVVMQPFNYTICAGTVMLGEMLQIFKKPLSLELMGKHFAVVADDCKPRAVAEVIVACKWLNMEENLDNTPDLIITVSSIKKQLLAAIRENFELNALKVQNNDKYRKYSRIGNERQFDRLTNALAETKGEIIFQCGDSDRKTLYFPPTLVDVKKGDPLLDDAINGPVLPVISFNSLDEAKNFVNHDLRWRGVSFLSQNPKTSEQFREQTKIRRFCTSH